MFKDSSPSGHVLHAPERSFFITTCQRIKHGVGDILTTTFRLIYLPGERRAPRLDSSSGNTEGITELSESIV